jgi:hypothetical protein
MRVARPKRCGRANKRSVSVEGLQHLTITFELAERGHPDLMEPYGNRLADAATAAERAEAMRAGLRETFRRRYPMPAGSTWPTAEVRA